LRLLSQDMGKKWRKEAWRRVMTGDLGGAYEKGS